MDTRLKTSASQHELTGEALNARIADLRKALKDWIPEGGMESVYSLERYHAYGVLPYSGGYLEQPAWLIRDFNRLELWSELVRLTGKLTPAKPGMPTMKDLVNGSGNDR